MAYHYLGFVITISCSSFLIIWYRPIVSRSTCACERAQWPRWKRPEATHTHTSSTWRSPWRSSSLATTMSTMAISWRRKSQWPVRHTHTIMLKHTRTHICIVTHTHKYNYAVCTYTDTHTYTHTFFWNTLEWLDRGYALRLQWLYRDFQLFWWLIFCINIKLHMSTQHLFNSKTNSSDKLKCRVFKGRQSWVFWPCCKNRKITCFF